jgi:hypothetical protein
MQTGQLFLLLRTNTANGDSPEQVKGPFHLPLHFYVDILYIYLSIYLYNPIYLRYIYIYINMYIIYICTAFARGKELPSLLLCLIGELMVSTSVVATHHEEDEARKYQWNLQPTHGDGSNLIHVPIIPLVLYTMVIFWDEIQDTRVPGFEKSCPIPTYAPSMIIYAGTLDGSCT